MRRKRKRPLPGTKEVSVYLPIPMIEKMHAIKDARYLHDGSDVKLSRLYLEAVEIFQAMIDMATGHLKRRAAKSSG